MFTRNIKSFWELKDIDVPDDIGNDGSWSFGYNQEHGWIITHITDSMALTKDVYILPKFIEKMIKLETKWAKEKLQREIRTILF